MHPAAPRTPPYGQHHTVNNKENYATDNRGDPYLLGEIDWVVHPLKMNHPKADATAALIKLDQYTIMMREECENVTDTSWDIRLMCRLRYGTL